LHPFDPGTKEARTTFDFGKRSGKKSYSDNILSTIRTNTLKNPSNTAVLFGESRLTWKDVWERSNQLGNFLVKLGLNREDRVLAVVSNWLGASEFGFISTCSFAKGLAPEGCVGKPMFDLELAVFDENGQPVPIMIMSGALWGTLCARTRMAITSL
jgi:acyl-coenzyme A synthetase/AMP-(fatty) acid ligase